MSEEVRQCFIRKRAINWLLSHATVMSQRVQRSFQLPNIATHLVREVAKDFLRCDRLSQANCPGAQDGQPGLRFRRCDAPYRSTQKAVGHLRSELVGKTRMAVTCDYNLSIFRVQGIKRVQEFFRGRALRRQKIQVIHQEGITLAEPTAKGA